MKQMNLTTGIRASALLLSCAGLLPGCSSDDNRTPAAEARFDFAQGAQGWTAGFADYPLDSEQNFELVADYRELPPELAARGSALFLSGKNESDDLIMYYKRRFDSLQPGRNYRVRYSAEIATEAPSGCFGVGGAPGESVYLKAGGSTDEPLSVPNDEGYVRMNVDVGEQSQGGSAALVLGDMANGRDCEAPPEFVLKSFDSGDATVDVTADEQGAVWLLLATDSGFESTTRVYFTRFAATFFE